MPLIRSPTVKPPSVEARTAISLVVPATPLPPLPLPSSAEIRPLTKVPCPTMSVTSSPPELVSKTRATWPANSGWLTSRPVSITDTIRVEPPPIVASASPARTMSYAQVNLMGGGPLVGSMLSKGSTASCRVRSRST